VAAVVLAAAFFGYGHMYYQGLRGLITTMAIGLALGTMFLRLRRNLWPIILVHAVVDSISMTAIFMAWK
jgi:membrane protease YdiL (CAAX protease family)